MRPLVALLGLGLTAAPLADPLTDLREIPVPAGQEPGQQNLTVGPDGRVYLSWIERLPDSSHALRFAVLGASWSQPRTIASGRDWMVNWADFPSMVVTSDNTLAAHWLQKSSRGTYSYDVRLAGSTDGGARWSAPVTPHRDGTLTEHGFVTLWPEGPDRIGAIWVDGRKTADTVRSRHEMNLRYTGWTPGGELTPEVEVDPRICDCCQTAAAVTSDGPVVVYRDRSAGEIRDIAIVRRIQGVWTEPRTVADDNWVINACPVNGPAIAADARRVAVAWFTAAGGPRRVKVAFSDDGGATFGTPLVVDDGRPVGRVAIVLLEGGDALVSWLEDTGTGADVRVRRVRPEGDIGDQMTITTTTAARPSGFPRMVRSGNRVVFAWRDPENANGARVRSAVARIR